MGNQVNKTSARLSGLYLESTPDERLGVLPGEERLVRDIMSRDVVTIHPSTSLQKAAQAMRDRHVPALVVMRDRRLTGIVTEHDMVIYGLTRSAPETVSVQDAMREQPPVACPEDAILHDAVRLMEEHRLQSLPVVNATGAVTGILSRLDVAGAMVPHVAAAWLARVRSETGAREPSEAR
jgi:CBS domain-containing protein